MYLKKIYNLPQERSPKISKLSKYYRTWTSIIQLSLKYRNVSHHILWLNATHLIIGRCLLALATLPGKSSKSCWKFLICFIFSANKDEIWDLTRFLKQVHYAFSWMTNVIIVKKYTKNFREKKNYNSCVSSVENEIENKMSKSSNKVLDLHILFSINFSTEET